jgi:hypothetical protein
LENVQPNPLRDDLRGLVEGGEGEGRKHSTRCDEGVEFGHLFFSLDGNGPSPGSDPRSAMTFRKLAPAAWERSGVNLRGLIERGPCHWREHKRGDD